MCVCVYGLAICYWWAKRQGWPGSSLRTPLHPQVRWQATLMTLDGTQTLVASWMTELDSRGASERDLTTSGTTNDNEWYNEWQRVAQRLTTNDNEWQRMTTGDNESQRLVQRMTTNVNEWPFQLIFLFFHIKEDPTTKHPKENFLNLEEAFEEGLLN